MYPRAGSPAGSRHTPSHVRAGSSLYWLTSHMTKKKRQTHFHYCGSTSTLKQLEKKNSTRKEPKSRPPHKQKTKLNKSFRSSTVYSRIKVRIHSGTALSHHTQPPTQQHVTAGLIDHETERPTQPTAAGPPATSHVPRILYVHGAQPVGGFPH